MGLVGLSFSIVYLPYITRYAIVTPETYPTWRGEARAGVKHLMQAVHMEDDQWQLGKSKVFIKNPESVRFLSSCLSQHAYVNRLKTLENR